MPAFSSWESVKEFRLVIIFFCFTIATAFYFRYVYGYFSRLFERQADLHVFKLGIPAEFMIEALDEIAVAAGVDASRPDWHHHSIQARIDFIKHMQKNPKDIGKYHGKVRLVISIYLLGLVFALLGYLFLFTGNV